jgi:hypothetical protein
MRSRNGGVTIAKNRKARRRVARVDCISELNLDFGEKEVGPQCFRPQERRAHSVLGT